MYGVVVLIVLNRCFPAMIEINQPKQPPFLHFSPLTMGVGENLLMDSLQIAKSAHIPFLYRMTDEGCKKKNSPFDSPVLISEL